MKKLQKTIIKIIFITLFFIATFTGEFFYRDPLFNNSVLIAKTLQDKLSFAITPLKIYTYLGIQTFMWVFIIFLFFPISYCYAFFLNVIISVHLCNYTKLIYGQGRPFLRNDDEAISVKMQCEAGYGNPSGHSFESTSCFLGFSQAIIDIWELGTFPQIIIYIINAILILLINFSRVILGVHSVNQVIYGDTLGFTVYFIIFQIIKPHKRNAKKFFERFLNLRYIMMNIIFFFVILLYIVLGAIFYDREGEKEFEDLKEKLKMFCEAKENRMLSRNSVYKSLCIMGYFGMILGLNSLAYTIQNQYYSKYNEANYYYKNTKKKWYFKFGIRFIYLSLCFIPLISFFIIPNNINIIILYVIGSSIPMFIFGFLLFGPYFIFNISFNDANIELYIPDLKKDGSIEYKLNEDEDEDEI